MEFYDKLLFKNTTDLCLDCFCDYKTLCNTIKINIIYMYIITS